MKTKLALAERTWTCHGCGAVHDRDLNAAINLARLSEHATRGTDAIPGAPAASQTGTAPPQGEAA